MERYFGGGLLLKVCLVSNEFFSWGVYGGFGAFTRKLGAELVKRGVEVEALVQKISSSQADVGETEVIDGVSVKTLPRKKPNKLLHQNLYVSDADVIHSQSGLYDTYLTFQNNLSKRKIVTFQDLRLENENRMLQRYEKTSGYPFYKRLWAKYVFKCFHEAVALADCVGYQAELLKPKIEALYNVSDLHFLPNFVDVPAAPLRKDAKPTVVWLGRLDPVKRPELFFKLAAENPDVDFVVLGKSHYPEYAATLKSNLSNVKLMGFQSGRVKDMVLRKAWVLCNTSVYECLPVSFLEAASYGCAVLSTQNPDNFTSKFGYHALKPDALQEGLKFLLKNDTWKVLGDKGRRYVQEVHSTEQGVNAHIDLYRSLIDEDLFVMPEIHV